MSSRSQRLAQASAERRFSNRLPIERAVRYKVFGSRNTVTQVGTGKTLNMSSRGVLFTCEAILPKGARVELTVSWPAKLDDQVPLNLVTMGFLIRSDRGHAAIAMERYEFKTRGVGFEEIEGAPWLTMAAAHTPAGSITADMDPFERGRRRSGPNA